MVLDASLNRHKQVKEYILKTNESLRFYGFAMYDDNEKICSVILLPFQGYSKLFKIISLMSWFSKIPLEELIQFYLSKKFINFSFQINL